MATVYGASWLHSHRNLYQFMKSLSAIFLPIVHPSPKRFLVPSYAPKQS